jgi:WD40 repeat protein
LPFDATGQLAALFTQITSVQPPSPRSLNPAIPKDLETICLKAMEKLPADRFATAGAFADELRRWLNEEPLTIRPPTVWERLRRWSRLNRVAARIAAGSAILLMVVSLALGTTAWKQANDAREAKFRAALETERTHEAHRLREAEARFRAEAEVRDLFEKARQRLRTPTEGRRWETQDLLRKTAEPLAKIPKGPVKDQLLEEFRSIFAATLAVPDFELASDDKLSLPLVYYQAWQVAMHPDGQMMAIGTHLGPICWNRGKKPVIPKSIDPSQPRPRLAFSPDGQFLAFAPEHGGLELWDGEMTRAIAQWKTDEPMTVMAVGFQGQAIWACGDTGRVQSLSLPELRPGPCWTLPKDSLPVTAAAFSGDATRLAVGDRIGRVQLFETVGRELTGWPADRIEVTALAWSPNNRLIATGTDDGTVKLWEADQRIQLMRSAAFPLKVCSILFDINGLHLLAASHAAPMKVWDVLSGQQVITGPAVPWSFSRDGRTIASGGQNFVGFGRIFHAGAVRPLHGHLARVERLAWSRDSRTMVTLDNRFEIRVWDVLRGVSIDEFHPPRGEFFAPNAAVALSDDGTLVAYASGGPLVSHALIRDVATGVTLARWELPGAYERMTCADGRFLLVREELDPDLATGRGPRQTVVRELIPGKAPDPQRVIRSSEPGDKSALLTSKLTHDGRLFLWIGPREPVDNQRLEVRDVSSGRLLLRIPRSSLWRRGEPSMSLDPEQRHLSLLYSYGKMFTYDLSDPHRLTDPIDRFEEQSQNGYWFASLSVRKIASEVQGLALRRRGENGTWGVLFNDDLSVLNEVHFSPDGRFLAWASIDGTITVADLPELERQVEVFERSTLSR